MTGFRVDPDSLREAIADLKAAQKRVVALRRKAASIDAGELTAGDRATQMFKEAVKQRAVGDAGSLEAFATALADKLDAKIQGYEETLKEYESLDDAASVDQRRTAPQA
ncbi:hypothetical protein SAMN02982929_02931 [Saccharopolyspora kobensis]|uniref:Excreted virulence factor EspC (Type VII ESX diderm) n=1 Tax=Saccharopolyspora kobensis TaxID=146035 RepID=A0A1H6BXE0_9PSEU|nr:hypothetical protein [Saccharopolyspora kobensis]SEG65360.1 hypothetical protein SAMN02982929_02931 [Saccharopolyspora kobensis]SFC19726.1 hypothetical protein SAMN05216506_101170 [Saccharopolyspora kobensis]